MPNGLEMSWNPLQGSVDIREYPGRPALPWALEFHTYGVGGNNRKVEIDTGRI